MVEAKCSVREQPQLKTIVMKTGWLVEEAGGDFGFKGDIDMTHAIATVIDVAQAEAKVPEDRDRILADGRQRPGGLEGVNKRVVSATRASMIV